MNAIITSAISWLLVLPGFRALLRELVLQGMADLLGPKSDPAFKAEFLALTSQLGATTTEEEKRAALLKLKALHPRS